MTTTDVPLRCECGAVSGTARGVDGDVGNRIFCYCGDCQSFQHFLGRADQILDPHGGTEIFQMSPARLEISKGIEHVALLHLKPGGLHRWYADCCKTAICNSVSAGLPFVGVIEGFFDHEADGRSREAVLGPVRSRCNAKAAKAKALAKGETLDAYDTAPLSMLFRFSRILLMAWLRGDGKRSPLFDAQTGAPCASPRVLTGEELREVEAAREAR
jgi:hypothetical protein